MDYLFCNIPVDYQMDTFHQYMYKIIIGQLFLYFLFIYSSIYFVSFVTSFCGTIFTSQIMINCKN